MAYKTFGGFILALHDIDKDAARYLATECIKNKEGVPSLVYAGWSPIDNWIEGFNCYNFFRSDETPQGREYWTGLNFQLGEAERVKAEAPKVVDAEAPKVVRVGVPEPVPVKWPEVAWMLKDRV